MSNHFHDHGKNGNTGQNRFPRKMTVKPWRIQGNPNLGKETIRGGMTQNGQVVPMLKHLVSILSSPQISSH
jgi:hypothetical protein